MKQLIIFDCGYLTHRAIFAWGAAKKRNLADGLEDDPIVASYSYLNTIYSTLRKIGIHKDTKILFAQDGWNSFRRAFYPPYKAQRKEFRESHEQIDWKKQYKIINGLERKLHESTNWNFLQLNNAFNFADLCLTEEGQEFDIESYDIDYGIEYGIESDDIQALAPKIFPDHEIVIVTIDKDCSQLYHHKNVKIFNPNLQKPSNKAVKGYYEIVDDPLGIIAKKVRLGDVSDNILIDKPNDTERDVDIRRFIIDMLSMPDYIEKPIISGLKNLDWNKKVDYENLPFPNSLGKKFDTIYDQSGLRTWDESVERHLLKEMKVIEKRSKRSVEEIYIKNAKYKILKDKYDECKNKKKKVVA